MSKSIADKLIPEWQYPLYKESDKIVYGLLERLGRTQKYPQLVASHPEINNFLKLLVLSQKMKDYRKLRDIILKEFKRERVVLSKILDESKDIKIPRGIDKSWAVFIQDKKLCKFMDKFKDSKIGFNGTNKEIVEFIIRFTLSQLLYDWRGPLLAVIAHCLEDKHVKVKSLNKLLERWDCTRIFGN